MAKKSSSKKTGLLASLKKPTQTQLEQLTGITSPAAPASTDSKIYYKYLVNGREYVESLSSPIANPVQQGYTQISKEEYQQRLPYNQMEEQQFRKLQAEGGLSSGQNVEILAEDFFHKINPGEDWSKNKNSYISFIQKRIAGEKFPNPAWEQAFSEVTGGAPEQPGGSILEQLKSPTPAQLETLTGLPQTALSQGFSTGNPQFDNILNNVYLPLLETELANDPSAVLNDAKFQQINEKVKGIMEKQYGPAFTKAQQNIEQSFALEQEGINLAKQQQMASMGIIPGQKMGFEVEKARTLEDTEIAKKREVRNFQDALKETSAAFATAGRAFGEGRKSAETGLEEKSQERLSDIERASQRRLQDLAKEEAQFGQAQNLLEQKLGISGLATKQAELEKQSKLGELEAQKGLTELGIKKDIFSSAQNLAQIAELFK